MRQSNAERVIENYMCGTQWFNRGDQLRVNEDNEIFDCGTLIGKIVDYEVEEDQWETFLILTMQDFKSQRNWRTHKRQLAHAANDAGLMVVFVDQLDIGFGVRDTKYTSVPEVYKSLITVAKYSQDDDIKTAAMCFKDSQIYAASYNQYVNDRFIHAEEALCRYIVAQAKDDPWPLMLDWQMLLEPCLHCLTCMLELGAEQILYANCHKDKWNTPEYIQFLNDIQVGIQTSTRGHKIKIRKESTKETIKFMEVKKA